MLRFATTIALLAVATSWTSSSFRGLPGRQRAAVPTGPGRTRRVLLAEPTLATFAVSGGPVIVNADAAAPPPPLLSADEGGASKPVLLYLPGIEMSGYSAHRQIPELSKDFEVRYLATSQADRSDFASLVALVSEAVEAEHNATGRRTFLVGESFGGVLALTVAAKAAAPPSGLGGVALINPATSVTRAWPSSLEPLLEALSALPAGLSDAAYAALATPIFAAISGDPLQLGGRYEDDGLPPPLRLAASARRLTEALPMVGELPSALPLPTLAFRLKMLLAAAKDAEALKLGRMRLPVQVRASSSDRALQPRGGPQAPTLLAPTPTLAPAAHLQPGPDRARRSSPRRRTACSRR